MKRYTHPDGGVYVIADDLNHQMKMDDGRWAPSVAYRRIVQDVGGWWRYEGKNIFHTTRERWAERFTEMPELAKSAGEV